MRRTRILSSAIMAGAFVLAPLATPSALAAPEFQIVSDVTYEVRPADRVVHVTVDGRVANYTPDSDTRRYYYNTATIVVLGGATGFTASAAGSRAGTTIVESDAEHIAVSVALNRNVFYRQTASFHLEFDLPNGSGAGDVRVGATVAAFPVWAIGTPDTPGGSVTIVVPPNFELEILGDERPDPTGTIGTERRFSWSGIADITEFGVYATADLTIVDPALISETITHANVLGSDVEIVIRAWRDDPAWAERTSRAVTEALPVLGELIGVRYFGTNRLVVEETVSRSIGGYAGIFDPSQPTDEIEIAFDVEEGVTYHEAAHAWFNYSLIAERWILEGFASYYGELAAVELGADPGTIELAADLEAAAFPLAAWGDPGIEHEDAELYGYAASLEAARALAERAGHDGLTVTWTAIFEDEAAYQPLHASAPETSYAHTSSWRYLLDVLEERTGETYADILEEWVIPADELALLDERADARAAYGTLVEAVGDWEVPADTRRQVNAWAFENAQQGIERALGLLGTRDDLLGEGAELQLDASLDQMQEPFELGDFGAAAVAATAMNDALDAYRAAEGSNDGDDLLESIGLIGADPSADLEAAAEAVEAGRTDEAIGRSAAAESTWDSAAGAGTLRVAAAGGVVVVVGGGAAAWRFRQRRRGSVPRRLPPADPPHL